MSYIRDEAAATKSGLQGDAVFVSAEEKNEYNSYSENVLGEHINREVDRRGIGSDVSKRDVPGSRAAPNNPQNGIVPDGNLL